MMSESDYPRVALSLSLDFSLFILFRCTYGILRHTWERNTFLALVLAIERVARMPAAEFALCKRHVSLVTLRVIE